MKADLTTRDHVSLLVSSFYQKVRADDLLGPIFNGVISDWNHHLEVLTRFWCNQLFIERGTYLGNPISVHEAVDDYVDNAIDERHFGRWLNLWIQTLDELFEGEQVFVAKNRARKMATHIHLSVFRARQ